MIVVRHAESEWNRLYARTRVDPGIRDPSLTETGRYQAERLIEEVARFKVRRLLASPYRRTLGTATIVSKALHLPIAVEPLVRERCVFSCDLGTTASRLADLYPDLDFGHLDEFWWGEPEESEASLGSRARAFRNKAQAMADRDEVAVISHWGFIRALTGEELANAACVRLRWSTWSPPPFEPKT